MAFIDLPILGRTEFETTDEGWWEFMFPYAPGPVEVDFNIDGREIAKAQVRRVEMFVADIAKFDALARAAIEAEYEAEDASDSREYHEFHLEELTTEEQLQCFGPQDNRPPGAGGLLRALKLERMGLYPETTKLTGYTDVVAVLDYSIGPDVTQYLLAVYFNDKGEAVCVSMES